MNAYAFTKLYTYPGAPAIPNGAVVIQDGIIRWLGPAESCSFPTRFLGGTAYPGFIDSHVHFTATGLDILALNAGDFTQIPDLLEAIHQLDKDTEGMVRVWGFDTDYFQEERLPTLAELDKACPHNLLWINQVESHATLVNSRSLEALGLPKEVFLVGEANQRARNFFLSQISREERERAIVAAGTLAVTRGVTTLHAMEGGALFHNDDVLALLALQDRLPVDTVIYPQVLNVDWAHGLGFKQVGGCLPLDGSSGVYTAALTRPYYNRTETGLLYHSREGITAMVVRAQELDMQVAMHACGDAAIDLFLDAVEAAQAGGTRDIRHRIEHFELPRYDQVERCKELNVILSMQPAFDWFWGGPRGDYAYTMGPEGWQNANPVGWAVKAGLLVAGGSDSGVTPLDPLLGIHAALNHHCPEQRVNLVQALAMFTENGAAAAGLNDRGALEVGKRGDIVVLDSDLADVPVDRIKDVGIAATIRRGELVYPMAF